MDFASLAPIDTRTGSSTGATLTVLNLDGAPLLNSLGQTHTLHLLGPDSDVYARAMHDLTQRRINEAAAAADRGEKPTPADPISARADASDVLARCTRNWAGFLDGAGEPIPFTLDAARELYNRFPLIREQADAFVSRRANFLPVSSAT
jgi:hypothetical protein